ncbi:MAG: hypothetical protein HYX34_00925 [Actinobacteria bacterium]|nr:hypothetical protein [Actinomycetota bacterium]
MVLSQKHRSSLYRTLSPMLGEEEAEALLSQFPARDLDEPVTKEFVRAEIATVRAELASLRSDVGADITALRGELGADIAALRGELASQVAGLRGELASEVAGLRGELASEVAGLRGELGSDIAGLRGELASLEARIGERLRQQTIWMAGSMVTAVGVAAGIATVLR